MAESKYGKLLITELKKNIKVPAYRTDSPGQKTVKGHRNVSEHVIWLDNEVFPGAKIYSECVWFWPADVGKGLNIAGEHSHSFDEVLTFFGTDLNDPHDLGGEFELWLDGEQHILTRTFLAFIPAGMNHCPLIIRRIERPIFHFSIAPAENYK